MHWVPFRTSPFDQRSRSSEGSTEREQNLELGVVVVFSVLCPLAVNTIRNGLFYGRPPKRRVTAGFTYFSNLLERTQLSPK